MSLNPNAPRFYSTSPSVSPSVSPLHMEKKGAVSHTRLGYAFPYTLRSEKILSPQKPFEMTVISNTHFRPIRS